MPKTVEEEYLNSLWAEPKKEQEDPLLYGSKVIQQAHARPTYQQLAASGNPISGLIPSATVVVPTDGLRGTAARLAASCTVSSPRQSPHKAGMLHAGTDSNPAASLTRLSPTKLQNAADEVDGLGNQLHSSDETELDAATLQKEVDVVIANVTAREKEFEDATLTADKAAELVATMASEIAALEAEEAELLSAQPPAPERLDKVQVMKGQREAALAAQQHVASIVTADAAGAEAALRAAEAELDLLADMRQALSAAMAKDNVSREEVMKALRIREEKAARGYLKRMQKAEADIAALQAEQDAMREQKIQAAEEAREKALERLHNTMQRVKRNVVKGQQLLEAQQAQRRDAVLGLKTSLIRVREEVARKASLYQALQKQKRETRERAFQDLIEQSLNPYEVHRRRDLQAQAARQRAQLRARIEARQVEIAARLAKEEETLQKQRIAAEHIKEVESRYQKEQGRATVEARIDEYMREHTITGQAVLDPTGRLPIDPSLAVVSKTNDFGTGRASQALLEKITQKHPDVRPKDMLIPVKYRPDDDHDDDDDDDDLSSENGGGARSRAYTERSTMTYVTSASAMMSTRSADKQTTGAGGPHSTGSNAVRGKGGWNSYEPKALTKLERANRDAAKARHKEAIAAPKAMMGKVFGGDAFITTPAAVEFKDFDVGGVYTTKVAVTNRSYAKNTFKVLEVAPEYSNVLVVNYQLPGHLATGVSGDISITFTPKTNEDIETFIDMLAETGPFRVPVRCLSKKANLSLSTPLVDFGPGVILGESVTKTLTLSNDGALDVDYSITCEDDDAQACQMPNQDGLLCSTNFNINPASGTVQGYGSVQLTITFRPSSVMPVTRSLHITYKSLSNRKLYVPPSELVLKGIGRDVPIFLERDVIDFKCVMVDHTYREQLVVRNGGKTAMKISVTNRPGVSEFIEFSPDFGFVQVGQVFPITVLFKPRAAMLQQCARYLVQPGESILEIPFKLSVPDQRLPVSFIVRAHITTTDLLFSPPSLDFGPCVMAEDTGVVLRVTNPSALPQTFGFVELPSTIRVMPNDGFGYILPGESVERIVSFQPPIPGPQSLSITAKSLSGRTFTLPITSVGIQPSLSMSHNKVAFPATPVNDVRTCSVVVRNNTTSPQAFEFGVPADSGLQFIPHVGEVPPASSMRIQIDFMPEQQGKSPRPSEDGRTSPEQPADVIKSATNSTTQPGSKQSSTRVTPVNSKQSNTAEPSIQELEEEAGAYELYDGDEGPTDDPNSWYSWRNFSVPCFIRPPLSTREGGSRPPSSSGYGLAAGTPSGEPQVLHLNVTTCAVNPDLVLRTPLTWVPSKRCYKMDFGPVPVGQRVTRSIQLFNQGQCVVPLGHEPLDHRQVFAVVAAWRDMAPNAKSRCLLAFQPQERADYLQILTINSPRTKLRIALTGQGIAPQLQLDPPHLLTNGLDLGDVAKGESSEAKFSITNVCPFPLSWAARFNGVVDPNIQNRPPFFCRPAEGTLAQGQACEVVVVFRPTQQRPYYSDVLQLDVPNQQEQLHIQLKGRGWEQGVYLAGPEYPPPNEDLLMEHQLAALATNALRGQQTRASTPQQTAATAKASEPGNDTTATTAAALQDRTPIMIGGPGTPSPLVETPLGFVPMAPLPPTSPVIVATFPHNLYLGESCSYMFEGGSLKSAAGAAAGEIILDGLTPAATAAGWSVDPLRVALTAGEKKPITITYRAPVEPHAGMAGLFGAAEYMELTLQATLKGGIPAPPTPEGRRMRVRFWVLVQPNARPASEAIPAGVKSAQAHDDEGENVMTQDKKGARKK